ncbi:unnamed protein product [Peniophora sp. CBMAI 1063]|nr:unnamed protein product [Peniophora sp. CBMAI 1063]
MMHVEPDVPTPAPRLLATVQLDNNYANEDEPVVEHVIPISVDWVLRGLELARVVPDIEHCTFEPGDVLMYTTEYTEDMEEEEDHAVNVRAAFTHSQELAEKHAAGTSAKSIEELVPEQYRRYLKVFDKISSERLPDHGPFDHAIDLKPEFEERLQTHPLNCKVYPMSANEQTALDTLLKDGRERGILRPSKSPMASPFFFVKKKDGTLRPVQDYRILNTGTVKNTYPLPLISDIVDRLTGAKIFSKMDVRWGYNNIRIKEGDEWKAAFKTNRGLFEPLVMFFGLTNSPATFQTMMNEIFRDMIDEGVISIYMDDILVHTKELTHHRDTVNRVLQRLQDHDLYLKPEKCQFERDSVEFLGLVVSHNQMSMDPVKVAGVMGWPTPRNIKEIQSFIGFTNFYRHFIADFSSIARPLFDLTKKMVP